MKTKPLKGSLAVPGDKSITHRALIFCALVEGSVTIANCSPAQDCLSTAACLAKLGLKISGYDRTSSATGGLVEVQSPGIFALKPPAEQLFAGNSGTTIRLLAGLLSGQPFSSELDGDASIRKRPMGRVLRPLAEMGANIKLINGSSARLDVDDATDLECRAPFVITGGKLDGRFFELVNASAQVQSALVLAGLQADGKTTIRIPQVVRDHTQRLLKYLEAPLTTLDSKTISVRRLKSPLPSSQLSIPSDFSSAAFFLVAAALIPGSQIELKNLGLNPGRLLVLEVLKDMGAQFSKQNQQEINNEPRCDLTLKYSGPLKGITVERSKIATGIDELPILALAGALCSGTFIVSDASELRYKESDRLAAIVENLQAAGSKIVAAHDGFTIEGQESLKGGSLWKTHGDHRLAMTGLIANLICKEGVEVEEIDSIAISYPSFVHDLNSLLA